LRLPARKQDVLRFLNDPRVPFTNNQAEGDACMMKVKQKIFGGFRSLEGARGFAVICSFISTPKKQGWNVIQASPRIPRRWPSPSDKVPNNLGNTEIRHFGSI
jgi:transposase